MHHEPWHPHEDRAIQIGVIVGCHVAIATSAVRQFLFAQQPHDLLQSWAFQSEESSCASCRYPLWSLISDFRMFYLWLTQQLDAELEKLAPQAKEG